MTNNGGAFPELKQTLPFKFLPIFGDGYTVYVLDTYQRSLHRCSKFAIEE